MDGFDEGWVDGNLDGLHDDCLVGYVVGCFEG